MILVPRPLAKILLTLEDRGNFLYPMQERLGYLWFKLVAIHGQWVSRLVAKKFHGLCLQVYQNLLYLFIYISFEQNICKKGVPQSYHPYTKWLQREATHIQILRTKDYIYHSQQAMSVKLNYSTNQTWRVDEHWSLFSLKSPLHKNFLYIVMNLTKSFLISICQSHNSTYLA